MFTRLRRAVARSLISAGESMWWRSTGAGGLSTPSGVTVTPSVAMQQTTIARCVGLIADTAAMMPLLLYERRVPGPGRDELPDHPIAQLVTLRPNEWQTPFEFWRHVYVHTALRGNGYAYLIRDGVGRVTEMLPLHSDFVSVYIAADRTPVYEFGFPYSGDRHRVTAGSILHLRWRGDDGYLGVSPVRLAAKAIGLSIAVEEHGARFFGDGARAGGVLSIPGKLSKDAVQRVRAQWEAQHSGIQGSRKVTVVSDGATYNTISVTPEESQFLESRGFQVEDMCRIYGVPPFLAGATSKVTSWGTGLEQQLKGFLSLTQLPWLTMGAQAARRDLLMPDERRRMFFEHDTDVLTGADVLARAQAAQIWLLNGVLNPNEVRADEGRNPYDGGDAYRVPANTLPQGADGVRAFAQALLALADQADRKPAAIAPEDGDA